MITLADFKKLDSRKMMIYFVLTLPLSFLKYYIAGIYGRTEAEFFKGPLVLFHWILYFPSALLSALGIIQNFLITQFELFLLLGWFWVLTVIISKILPEISKE